MNAEVRAWLGYAGENLQTGKLCLQSGLLNPCLQNAQQAAEKALKALCLVCRVPLKRTHSIQGLCAEVRAAGIHCGLTDDECDLLDSIYLPSKYPLGSVLPDFEPDEALARQCLAVAERVLLRYRDSDESLA
ncbi:MAG: HEPN domain-containing protein [Planctomycetota bacterium]